MTKQQASNHKQTTNIKHEKLQTRKRRRRKQGGDTMIKAFEVLVF
jgi:hypothetical protein